jgi:conjugative transfer signal peptidase TraF
MSAIACLALAMLLVSPHAAPGALVFNSTPSVPVGLYRIEAASWARGDLVAVRPGARLAEILARLHILEPGRLLLKRVAAASGDAVCRNGGDISVNGRLAASARDADSRGKMLPVWAGCQRLGAHQVLLLGEVSASFDGRYFGPSDAADIIGRIAPVILLPGDPPAEASTVTRSPNPRLEKKGASTITDEVRTGLNACLDAQQSAAVYRRVAAHRAIDAPLCQSGAS